MKNKGLVLAVCLVLLVFGFSSAVAEDTETVTTISVELGSQLEVDDVVNQVLKTTAIRIHTMPEGYGAFVLSLNDTDALKSLFKFEADGVYVQSPTLGETPLYFTWEDVQEFIFEQLEANADMLEMSGMFNMDMMRAMMDGSMTEEEALEMMGIDEELMRFVSDIEANQTVETGTFALSGSDVANQKIVTVLTNEDIIRAVELPIVRKQMSRQISGMYPELTEEEINQEIDGELDEVKQVIEENDISVAFTVYTADEAFVAFTFELTGMSDGEPVSLLATATKTTIETAAFYQLSVTLYENGEEFVNQYGSLYVGDDFISGKYTFYSEPDEPVFAAALNCDMADAGHITGDLAITVYDGIEESALIVFDQQSADAVTDTVIDVFIGGSVEDIKASLTASKLITINIHTVQQPDSGFFSALQNASPETSVQLLQMTDDELDEYFQGLEESLMMTVLTVVDNLPAELSNSLMQEMNGF